jgi:hypothetical protein
MGILEMGDHEVFESQIDQVCETFPKLRRSISSDGTTIVKGELHVIDEQGKLWETYQVEIHPRDGFPFRFPYVFETGGKIPRIADWHIYDDTQSCCIAVEPEEYLVCKKGISLTGFIKDEMLPYFFNQTHRRVLGFYANGEFSHGISGIYEFYDEILKTKGVVRETIRLMLQIADTDKPGRTHDCFCGSKEKFRRCHKAAYEKLSQLGRDMIYQHANRFAKAIDTSVAPS